MKTMVEQGWTHSNHSVFFNINFLSREDSILEILAFLILGACTNMPCIFMFLFPLSLFPLLGGNPTSVRIFAFRSWFLTHGGPETTKEGVERQSRGHRKRTSLRAMISTSLQKQDPLQFLPLLLPFKVSLKKRCYPSRKEKKNELPLAPAYWRAPAAGPRRGEGTAFTTLCTYLEKSLIVELFDHIPRTQQRLLRG